MSRKRAFCLEPDLPYPVMRPDRETRLKWIQAYESAPRVQIPDSHKFGMAPRGSVCSVSAHSKISLHSFKEIYQ